ncbi:MAG: glucose 1-dehydrogenase [Sphingomonadales bacterium]|nr:glucose 1-dehydrogenase [Sphingomonadales bacterium]MBD3772530.1 glucose 1-dehydrogenase [Paracoccaceae bacterium]
MGNRLAGKRALVTGAAQGLGAAISRGFVREGAQVMLTDMNAAGAQATADALNDEFGARSAFACGHDVTSEEAWQAALAAAQDAMGGLSVLVNNAGIGGEGDIETCTLTEWRRTFAVNSDGVFLGCKYALAHMKDSQPGSIINLSSIAGLIASHAMPAYNASKAACWMLTKSVALYCARQGWDIRCNSIHPTFVDTPILDGFGKVSSAPIEVIKGKLARQIPLGRLGVPDEIANGAIYLASDESRFMTGAELKLDGGISAM